VRSCAHFACLVYFGGVPMALQKPNFNQMTDNNLHLKMKPVIKSAFLNKVLTCTGQNVFKKGI